MDGAQRSFEDHSALRVRPLVPAETIEGISLPPEARETCWVGAVAAAMTLREDAGGMQVADLLSSVRTERESSLLVRWAWTLAPVVLAASLLMGLFTLVERQRKLAPATIHRQVVLEERIAELREMIAEIQKQQTRRDGLEAIARAVQGSDDEQSLFERIPQVLPDAAKLDRMVLAEDGSVRLSGTALNESAVYDVVSGLRRLPGVHDVVLQETSPVNPLQSEETEFAIVIKIAHARSLQKA